MDRVKYIDNILKESKDLELIVAYYSKHKDKKRAKSHIKRVLNEITEKNSWNDLAKNLRRYQSHLNKREKKRYVDKIVEKGDSFTYDEAALVVIEDFSDLVNDNKLSSLIFNTLNSRILCQNYESVDGVYEIIEKNKERLSKSVISSKLPIVLGKLIANKEMKKEDISKFKEYIGEKEKCNLFVRILMNTSRDQEEFFDEYKEFLDQKNIYNALKRAISDNLRFISSRLGLDEVTGSIKLLRDYLQKEQVTELLSMITDAQLKQIEHEHPPIDNTLREGSREIENYGIHSAYRLLKHFPDEFELGQGKKIVRTILAEKFFEQANTDYENIEGVEQFIKKYKRFVDKRTVESALAEAVKKDIGFHWDKSPVLKKFNKYISKEHIGKAIAEYLPYSDFPGTVIENFGDYLSEEQIKTTVQDYIKRLSLRGNFREPLSLLNSAKERLDQEELSDFFTDLFEEVKTELKIPDYRGDDFGRTDFALDYLKKFEEHIKIDSKDIYHELLEIRKEIKKED